MEKRRLGNSGLQVSRIALGCMSFGDTSRGFSEWSMGDDEAQPFFQQAVDLGVNFWDTADGYGTHPHVGEGLKGLDRESVVVNAKTAAKDRDTAVADVERFLATVPPPWLMPIAPTTHSSRRIGTPPPTKCSLPGTKERKPAWTCGVSRTTPRLGERKFNAVRAFASATSGDIIVPPSRRSICMICPTASRMQTPKWCWPSSLPAWITASA